MMSPGGLNGQPCVTGVANHKRDQHGFLIITIRTPNILLSRTADIQKFKKKLELKAYGVDAEVHKLSKETGYRFPK